MADVLGKSRMENVQPTRNIAVENSFFNLRDVDNYLIKAKYNINNMELKHLKSFVLTADTASFSVAVSRCYLTQPAVSQHIFEKCFSFS